jgi:hypothetical protein
MAVATVGAVMLSVSRPAMAAAGIEVFVQSGGSTIAYYDSGVTSSFTTPTFTIGAYTGEVETVNTNFPGVANLGSMSTTANITTVGSSPATLTITVMIVDSSTAMATGSGMGGSLTDPLSKWTNPTANPVVVSSASSFATNSTVTGGLVTTTTYFDSPPAATFMGSTAGPVSSQNNTNTSGNSFNSTGMANPGPGYSLSEQIVLTGINPSAAGFNFGGTSSVTSVPEPTSLAIAGIGGLGLIGYGLRRRKALGA